jgi:hypothetical protein
MLNATLIVTFFLMASTPHPRRRTATSGWEPLFDILPNASFSTTVLTVGATQPLQLGHGSTAT